MYLLGNMQRQKKLVLHQMSFIFHTPFRECCWDVRLQAFDISWECKKQRPHVASRWGPTGDKLVRHWAKMNTSNTLVPPKKVSPESIPMMAFPSLCQNSFFFTIVHLPGMIMIYKVVMIRTKLFLKGHKWRKYFIEVLRTRNFTVLYCILYNTLLYNSLPRT